MRGECSPSLRKNAMYVRRNERRALEEKGFLKKGPLQSVCDMTEKIDPGFTMAYKKLEEDIARQAHGALTDDED